MRPSLTGIDSDDVLTVKPYIHRRFGGYSFLGFVLVLVGIGIGGLLEQFRASRFDDPVAAKFVVAVLGIAGVWLMIAGRTRLPCAELTMLFGRRETVWFDSEDEGKNFIFALMRVNPKVQVVQDQVGWFIGFGI